METLLIVVSWFVLSLVAGIVAHSRGRFGPGYFVLSLVASPLVGLLLAGLMPPKSRQPPADPTKRCPECAEVVLVAATKCKHCGAVLPPPPRLTDVQALAPDFSSGERLAIGVALLVAVGFAVSMCSRKEETPRHTATRSPEDAAFLAKVMCKAKIEEGFKVAKWIDQDHWRVDWPYEGSWVVSAQIVGNEPNKPKARLSFSCLVTASGSNDTLVVTQLLRE